MRRSALAALVVSLCAAAPLRAGNDELSNVMESVDHAFKGLAEVQGAEALRLVREAQEGILRAMTMTPELAGGMPEGPARELALVDYRMQLSGVYQKFLELEKALIEGKPEVASALRAEITKLRKQGHRAHVKPD